MRRFITAEQTVRVHALTALGWSQAEIARDVGVSKTVVARIQRGKHQPRMLGRTSPTAGRQSSDPYQYAREHCEANRVIRALRERAL